jgi:hypothetical protein
MRKRCKGDLKARAAAASDGAVRASLAESEKD